MNYRCILLTAFCCMLPLAAHAQTTVSGVVIDRDTREPIAGATILTEDTRAHAVSDNEGKFQLSSGQIIHMLTIRSLGYVTQQVNVPQDAGIITVELVPASIMSNEVQVLGAMPNERLLGGGASVSLLTDEDFRRSDNIFLQNTLNLVPGVQMNVRSSSSQSNILIRGIGTYSRFSIRGIKLYMNGMPLTDADGTTTLDDVDFTSLGQAVVIKGPASTVYGSNLGGSILLQTRKAPEGELSLNQSVTAGSFGLLRTNTSFMAGTDKVNTYINYGYQQVEGFREHTNSTKDFVTVASDFSLSDNQSVSLLAAYTNVDDQYAGELDSAAYLTSPEIAFPAYIDKNIGLQQETSRLAVSHVLNFSPEFSNATTLFTSGTSKVSPVEPRFSRTSQTKYGGRTIFTYSPVIGSVSTQFKAGAEFNSNFNVNKAYQISDSGVAGSIIGDNEIYAYQTNVFLQGDIELLENTTMALGASYNIVAYRNLDFLKTNLSGRLQFDPAITPRIALTHIFDNGISVFAQLSSGFLPPTASQITLSGVNLPNYINTDLKPEKNIDYEIGSRGMLLSNRLEYDITLYAMSITNALVQQTISGVTAFANAGESSYMGAELSASYQVIEPGSVDGIEVLRPWITYAYNKTKFEQYVLGDKDFSGNAVTGTVPNLLSAGVDFELALGAYLHLIYHFVDKMPITDANSLYTDAYSLINARVGYQSRFSDHVGGELFAGAENLTDIRYPATIALNSNSPRYYVPAPGRNFYGGLTINYIF